MISQRLSDTARAEKDENEQWNRVSTHELGWAETLPDSDWCRAVGQNIGAENCPDPPWESGLTRSLSMAGHGGQCAHSLRSPMFPLGSELR